MAYIDAEGLFWPEPGDILKVEHRLRKSSYAEIEGGKPSILVFHLTGNHIPLGCDTSASDGTKGMAGRVSAGTAKYYAHGYLGRDGWLWQTVPLTRAAIHVAGRWEGRETNRIATGIEVTNLGYVNAATGQGPGFKVTPSRADLREHGSQAWHILSEPQNSAIIELAAAWRAWSGARVVDCLRGHQDVDPGSTHMDPGPELRAFLDGPVRSHLESAE